MSETTNTGSGSIANVEMSPYKSGDCLSQQVRDEIARDLIVTQSESFQSNYVLSPNPPSDTSKLWRPSNSAGTEPLGDEVFAYNPATGQWESIKTSVPPVPTIYSDPDNLITEPSPNQWAVLTDDVRNIVNQEGIGISGDAGQVLVPDSNGDVLLTIPSLISTDAGNQVTQGSDGLLNVQPTERGYGFAEHSPSGAGLGTTSTGIPVVIPITGGVLTGGTDVTISDALDAYTINTAGDYFISVYFSCSGAANDTFDFSISINGGSGYLPVARKMGSGGDVGAVALSGILTLAAGNVIQFEVANRLGTSDLVGEKGGLTISRIS